MKSEVFIRLANILLRGLSLGSRFILIFYLAKLLPPEDVGLFGLMLATISLMVLLIGGDFYTYSQRELLARPINQWSFVLQNQIKAQLLLYVILLPAQIFLFILGFLEWSNIFFFFALLVTEHIAQELNRLLIAMQRQLLASIVMFIRMGSWVLVIIPIMYFNSSFRELNVIYSAWLMASFIAVFIGIIFVLKVIPTWRKQSVNYDWIKQGFKVGGYFLIATLCFRGLLTFDRYAVEAFGDVNSLGVYVFYIGIVMGLFNFLDPAVFSFLYPKLLQHYQQNEKEKFIRVFNELKYSTILLSGLLSIMIWLIMPYIVSWIDKPIYSIYISSLPYLIAAGFVQAISYIPHYALYAMKADKWILLAHISSVIVFFASLFIINLDQSIELVSISLLAAFTWITTVKTIGYFLEKKYSTLLNQDKP